MLDNAECVTMMSEFIAANPELWYEDIGEEGWRAQSSRRHGRRHRHRRRLAAVIPVIVLMSGGVLSAVLGYFLGRDADARYDGSELLKLDD